MLLVLRLRERERKGKGERMWMWMGEYNFETWVAWQASWSSIKAAMMRYNSVRVQTLARSSLVRCDQNLSCLFTAIIVRICSNNSSSRGSCCCCYHVFQQQHSGKIIESIFISSPATSLQLREARAANGASRNVWLRFQFLIAFAYNRLSRMSASLVIACSNFNSVLRYSLKRWLKRFTWTYQK